MTDVSKISLQTLKNTSTFNKRAQKLDKPKEEEASLQPVVDHKEPEQILDALALSGSTNKALLVLNIIDPAKYLTPERIAAIEKSMKAFEQDVEKNLTAIEQEFPDMSEGSKLGLAAQMTLE